MVKRTHWLMQETYIRDTSSIPGWQKSPEGGHGNPFGYSCLENLMDNKNLVGYSPWGHKETDMPEATEHTHTLTY